MIKNIIILILLVLLILVWYGLVKPAQIASLWNEIKTSSQEMIAQNSELFKDGTDKVTIWELLSTNGSILKNYWMESIDIILQEDDWEQTLKNQLLQKILIDSWHKTVEDLEGESKVAYLLWLEEIETAKNNLN